MRQLPIWSRVSGISIRLQPMEIFQQTKKKGYSTRLNYLSNSQTVELYGPLHADFFNSDRMLINIKLTRAPIAFYLLGPSDDTKIRIKILDATLYVNQIKLKPLF